MKKSLHASFLQRLSQQARLIPGGGESIPIQKTAEVAFHGKMATLKDAALRDRKESDEAE
jgi:hypothetical protein